MPKVSICIPTFNRVHLLSSAIESALQQTYSDLEVIVCDDGSSDATPDMMAGLTDSRVRYLRHPQNIGKSNNMRSGFEAATGEYFIKFDDDDRLTPEFLAQTCAVLDRDPAIDFVSTDHWIIDINGVRDPVKTEENSRFWGRTTLPAGEVQNLLEVVFVQQCLQIGATLFRRRVLQEVGFMLPNLQNCEDNDLLVRLALAGKKAYYLPERLMEYRFHAGQHGLDRDIRYLTDKLNYLESYDFESAKLEQIRRSRLAQTKLRLGLRLIEKGETQKGQEMVWQTRAIAPTNAWAGLTLSILPLPLRSRAFQVLRQLKPAT